MFVPMKRTGMKARRLGTVGEGSRISKSDFKCGDKQDFVLACFNMHEADGFHNPPLTMGCIPLPNSSSHDKHDRFGNP